MELPGSFCFKDEIRMDILKTRGSLFEESQLQTFKSQELILPSANLCISLCKQVIRVGEELSTHVMSCAMPWGQGSGRNSPIHSPAFSLPLLCPHTPTLTLQALRSLAWTIFPWYLSLFTWDCCHESWANIQESTPSVYTPSWLLCSCLLDAHLHWQVWCHVP